MRFPPDAATEDAAALIAHWLFCTTPPEPSASGALQAEPASLRSRKALDA